MRQIVLEEPHHFAAHIVPAVTPGPGEALVRIRRIAVCGSDWHAYDGNQPNYSYPRIIGHELSCEVVEAPGNARGIKPGDRCAIEPHFSCGTCRPCRLNRPNCCTDMKVFGVHVDGGMRALAAVPVERLFKSARLSFDQLALVEFLTIGAHAVVRSGLAAGDEVLVVGAGPIGLAVLQFALLTGASARIVEKVEYRREFAARFGVEVLPEYDGRPAPFVFDATGDKEAITASFERTGAAGTVVLVGQLLDTVPVDHTLLMRRELTLKMSRNSHDHFPRVIGMMERGELDIEPWITCRMPMTAVPDVFGDLATRKNYIKALFEVEDSDL
jgi:2-desacetyl-2-hydroxyethyl bacteriochlorophyllide A dehydrogenase